jgi:ferric-dicitrate binding protein FerR (iron transport regulator)
MDKNRLRQYLDGQGTPEERKEVETYLADHQSDFTALQEVLHSSWENTTAPGAGDPVLKQELLDALHTQLFAAPVVALSHAKSRRRWFRLAAAVLLPLIMGMVTWKYWRAGKIAPAGEAVIAWKTLENTGSVQKVAVLPDSTHVWLSPGSRLSYTAGYVNNQRAVQLQGEAFFDVAPDAAHPFMVHAGQLVTQVLGTSFNVEAYLAEQNIRVSLVSGKVAIRPDSSEAQPVATLQPGELLVYNTASRAHQVQELKMKQAADWTSGNIVFSDVPLQDALQRIATRYNLSLKYAKGVDFRNKRFTSVFRNETPEEMLQLLLFISDSRFRMKGNIVEILP